MPKGKVPRRQDRGVLSPAASGEPLREGQSSLEGGGKAPNVRIHSTGISLSHWRLLAKVDFPVPLKK